MKSKPNKVSLFPGNEPKSKNQKVSNLKHLTYLLFILRSSFTLTAELLHIIIYSTISIQNIQLNFNLITQQEYNTDFTFLISLKELLTYNKKVLHSTQCTQDKSNHSSRFTICCIETLLYSKYFS